jgi:hypothetical protein
MMGWCILPVFHSFFLSFIHSFIANMSNEEAGTLLRGDSIYMDRGKVCQ